MPLETASTIAELNSSNPIGASDAPAALDDHIRLIKTVLKADALVEADKGVANGVATLNASSKVVQTALLADSATSATNATNATNVTGTTTASVPTTALGSGTANSTTYLRGDRTFATVTQISIASTAEAQAGTNNTNAITPLRMREGFNASGSAPVYACRAWVSFEGSSSPSVNASGNVSSVAYNGTGKYTINFSTALPDTNYAITGNFRRTGTATSGSFNAAATGESHYVYSTTAVAVGTANSSGTAIDVGTVFAAIFR